MEASPIPRLAPNANPAGVPRKFLDFLTVRFGSEPKAAVFLEQHLLPALRTSHPSDETMVTAWFTKLFRKTFNEYIASHIAPIDCARAWLACGQTSPGEEEKALRACVGHAIEGVSPACAGVLRQVELHGASLWAAGVILDLNAHVVWARLRNGRGECRTQLVRFLAACAAEAALASEEREAVGE